ncbi:MAG: hypothetical protein WAW37_05775 [Syntrophobacteraceae bacterium]
MEARKMTMALIFALTLSLSGAALFSCYLGAAFGATEEAVQPPPPMFPKMGLSGITGDQDYLYVLAGGKIMLYQLNDMVLVKTVDLPDPPSGALPPKPDLSQFPPPFPPPHGGGPHGLWVGGSFLYVLAGPVIHEYSTPDLSLVSSKELPRPELPKTGK